MPVPAPAPIDDAAGRLGRLGRLGRWYAAHPWRIAAAWVLVLILATAAAGAFGGTYSDNFTLPDSPSEQGLAVLKAHDRKQGGQGGQLVFTVATGSLAADRAAIERATAAVRAEPHVLSAADPFAAGSVSASGRTAVATLHFDTNPQKLGKSYVGRIDTAVAPARAAGVSVNYGGALGKAASPKNKDSRSALIGIVIALIVLLAGFGSVYAAGLPLVSAGLATLSGLGILGLVAASSTFPTVSPTFAVMMGLGVGIDYALFLATRHRQRLIDGRDPVDAAAEALATSGRAVVVAATTVVVALLALYASGMAFMGQLGLAGAIGVAVGALAALTLTPALLGLLGTRIDRHHVRTPVAESTADTTGWGRYARTVGAHPGRFLLSGACLLCVLAIPFFSMRLGHVDAGADPTSDTAKRAYDAITAAFGPGANGPFTIAISLRSGTSSSEISTLETKLHQALAATPDVAEAGPVHPNASGDVLVATVIPHSSPQAAATDTLQATLRDTTLPGALAGSGAKGYVTGSTSEALDFRNQISSRLPLIVAVVVAIAFVLLLLNFRSPVLALKAAVLNLLSIGAAYGVIVAVFQWGWGGSLLGVSEKIPIESYVPMMMFAIVFGLSMDYEVFLLSRVREAWLRTGDNHASVAAGLAATARVITCAALIMTSVFLAFLLSTSVVIKMLALGLGASILIDATVIRLVVVPAAMFLLGEYNWWTPRWLDRLLGGHRGEHRLAWGRGRLGHRGRAGVAAAALGAVVLAAFAITFLTSSSAGSSTKTGGKRLAGISSTVAVSTVKDAQLTSHLTLAATVGGADGPVSLTPQTAGTVTSLSISSGQTVEAGQIVARLSDTQGLQAKQAAAQQQLAQAQAVLAQAQSPQPQPANVAQANEQLAAAQNALKTATNKQSSDQRAARRPPGHGKAAPGTVSPAQLSEDAAAVKNAQTQLGSAQQALATAEHPPAASSNLLGADQAAVNAAQDNLDAANQALAQLTVTAPVAGTIAQILVPVGGYASPTTPIATLTGDTEMLTAQASPLQVSALTGKVGAHATASIAIPSATTSVAAILTQIAPSASAATQQTAVTFATTTKLQSGAPVQITVDLPEPRGPAVPADAVVASGGRQGVYVVTGVLNPAALGVKLPADVPAGTEVGTATFAPTKAGVTENGTTQVLSGLTSGQTVVITGQSDLASKPGAQRVAILPASGSASSTSKKTTGSPSGSKAASAAASGIDVTVVSVHGSTLTVSTPIGQKTFPVPAGFHITRDGHPIALGELHAGDVLKVAFTRTNGKLTPVSAALQ